MREKYTRYSLGYVNAVPFADTSQGNTLSAELIEYLNTESYGRLFLRSPLSPSEKLSIQPETLETARDAVGFQAKVAGIEIAECYEPLIDLKSLNDSELKWSFTTKPYHEACGDWAGKERLFYVRVSMANALIKLEQLAESIGYAVHFEDAFRPTGVQEGLFKRRIQMAKTESPTLTDEQIILEAKSKTAFTPRMAAHKAGAAVDLLLRELESGELLDIGHGYPEGGEIVRMNTPYVTQQQWKNRKTLAFLAKKASLVMYPYEDWHLCIGDATAAVVNNEPTARYGPIHSFADDGTIVKSYSPDELDNTFTAN